MRPALGVQLLRRTIHGLSIVALFAILLFVRPVWAVEVEMRAAWGGVATQAAFTELIVGIRAPEAGSYVMTLPGRQGATSIGFDVPQDRRITFSVPYPVSGPGPVAWSVSRRDNNASVPVAAGRVEVFSRVARKPWDVDLVVTGTSPRTVNLMAATLPTHTQAYDSIRSITLTPRDLRNLTPEQLRAFEAFLQRCGRAIVLETQPGLLARLRGIAGCGGRHVHADRQGYRPPELPTARDLRALVDCVDCGGALNRLTALLVIYAGLLLACALLARVRTLAALGILASLILIAISRPKDPHITWAAWAQADAETSWQLRRTVLVVDGQGASKLTVPLLRTSVPHLPLPDGAVLSYRIARSQTGTAALTLPNGYLSRKTLSFIDSGPTEALPSDPAAADALALADRLSRKTGLTLDLGASVDRVTQPALGIRSQWRATVIQPDEGKQ